MKLLIKNVIVFLLILFGFSWHTTQYNGEIDGGSEKQMRSERYNQFTKYY